MVARRGRLSVEGPPLNFGCTWLFVCLWLWALTTALLTFAGADVGLAAFIGGLMGVVYFIGGLTGNKPKPDKPPTAPLSQPKPEPEPAVPRVNPPVPVPAPMPKPELKPRTSSEALRREHFTALFLRDSGRCGICGKPLKLPEYRWGEIEVDHVHPHSEGGRDSRDNLQLAHASCNASKGARTWDVRHESLPPLSENPPSALGTE